MSAASDATKRKARSTKDLWIQSMVPRRGKKCTAITLANKTVRTAYAMLTQSTEYEAGLI
jgi:transposase